MECPRCHSSMKEGETYCVRCGFNQLSAQNNTNATVNHQIDFLECFIGDHVDEIKMQNFSWCAFFFGVQYYFYRKMYVEGFVIFSIYSAVSRLISKICPIFIIYFVIDLFFWLLIASMTKQLYISQAKKKINKLRKEYPNLNDKDFAVVVRKKGGTSILGFVVTGGIVIILLGSLVLLNGLLAHLLGKSTIENTVDRYTIYDGYDVINNLKLGISEKSSSTEVIPINTSLPILDYVSYQKPNIKGGNFLLDENSSIKLLDLKIERQGNVYICSGTAEEVKCKKK